MGTEVATLSEAKAHYITGVDFQTFLGDDLAFGELGKCIETLNQVLAVAIDVKVVGVDGVDNADVGIELEERAVELVGFNDKRGFVSAKVQVAVEVLGNATDEGSHIDAALMENVCHHGGGGGFAMSTCHGNGEMVLGDGSEGFGAFHHGDAASADFGDFIQVLRDSWSIDDIVNEGWQ